MFRAKIIASVCNLIGQGRIDDAKMSLLNDYPHVASSTPRKAWTMRRLVQVFVRDGFTDRYFGEPLVFPGTLRALAILLTDTFPYHRNWKQSATHPAFWDLYPTIDHVVPVARGGADDEGNVVTTSMLRNTAKSNWLLEELGWPVDRAPIVAGWDGLVAWFLSTYETHEELRRDRAVQLWHRAAIGANAIGGADRATA